MKIAYTGLDLPAGKIKHRDEIFTALVERDFPVPEKSVIEIRFSV